MTPRGRGQLRISSPAMRRQALAQVRACIDHWRVRDVSGRAVECYYDAAGGDVLLAAEAIRDVAGGRVNEELRQLLTKGAP